MIVEVLLGASPLHAWIGSNPLLCQHPHLVAHPEEDPQLFVFLVLVAEDVLVGGGSLESDIGSMDLLD
jgi:hypothetical protein